MKRRKFLSIDKIPRWDLSRLGAHEPHERAQRSAPEDRSECWKSSDDNHDCRNKESQRQEMDTRGQTKGDRFTDRPPRSQILDRRRFQRFERRLGGALTDTSVLPFEEGLVQSRRFAADVPIAPLAPGSCACGNWYRRSAIGAVCLASHHGEPRVALLSLADASKN